MLEGQVPYTPGGTILLGVGGSIYLGKRYTSHSLNHLQKFGLDTQKSP